MFKLFKLKSAFMLSLVLWFAIFGSFSAYAGSDNIPVHDPSMIAANGCYYVFSTGGTIAIHKLCPSRTSWTYVGNVFGIIPPWIRDVIGSLPADLWAPDINYFNGKYYLYYAGSTFGSNKSVIGLATATDLNGTWTDEGEVFHSEKGNTFNAIDPNLAWDSSGQAWMSFGSFWDGIKMRQIDPATGKLLSSNIVLYSLASRGGGAIEASSILHVGKYYYLFVSFDRCCAGINSTYRIMMGRSEQITGPFVDKDGKDMMNGGGTQLLATEDQYIGPGGEDVLVDGSTNRLIYHYYDGKDYGRSKLAARNITIDGDGWPVLGPVLSISNFSEPVLKM